MSKQLRYLKLELENVEQVRDYVRTFRGWLFRGQANVEWPLKTSLERASELYECRPEDIPLRETEMYREFESHAQFFLQHLPKEDSCVDWLSIMQHYGCPTRLLDVTESLYVALHFAIENTLTPAVVWGFNPFALRRKVALKCDIVEHAFTLDYASSMANAVIAPRDFAPRRKLVVEVKPKYMNQRRSNQRGLFLAPLDVSASFEENLSLCLFDCNSLSEVEVLPLALSSHPLSESEVTNGAALLRLHIPLAHMKDLRCELAELGFGPRLFFPGLDGFCQNLRSHLLTAS